MSFNNVKSSYYIKFLFSYLSEQRKLSLVKYSKSIQNILNLQFLIINYLVEDILNMNQMEKQKNLVVMMIILYMKENI